MFGKRGWITSLITVGCLLAGVGLGLTIGWVIAPVEYVDTNLAFLHPTYKADFMLMVSETFALDGDLNTARARLALLALPEPGQAVADLAEDAINRQLPSYQIRALAELADALDVRRDTLAPYLPATVDDTAP